MPQDNSVTQAATGTAMDEHAKQIDIGQILSQILNANQRSTVPLTTNSSSGGTFIPPVQKQIAPVNIDGGREFRSRGAANLSSASNLFGNVASMINTAKQNSDAQKTRRLAIDVERAYSAQAGIDRARAILQQNPNDPDAKQMLEKNSQIINDMLSDPKRRKEFEEAFNYSFIGDDKKANSWQRKAGQMGAQTYQQQLEKQMPQTQQINPIAVQEQKAESERLKAMMPAIAATIRAASMGNRDSVTRQNKIDELQVKQDELQQKSEEAWLKHQDYRDRTSAEKMRYQAMFQRNALMAQNLSDKMGQAVIKNALTANKQAGDMMDKNIRAATTRLNALTNKNPDDLSDQEKNEVQFLSSQIKTLRERAVVNQAKQDAYSYVLSGEKPGLTTTSTGETKNANPPSKSGSSRTTGRSAAAAASPDDQSDEDLLNDFNNEDEEDDK